MQIVIDIPEQDYYNVLQYVTLKSNTDFENLMIRAVQNGTPLPKGHGRLIDADAFIKTMEDASKRHKYKELLIDDLLTVDDVFKAIIESLQNKGLAEGDALTIIEKESDDKEVREKRMTRKEKIALLVDELEYIRCDNFDADTDEDKTLKEAVRVIEVLKQEPSEDWHDVPSYEMTLGQARQAVRDLRKFVMDNHILPKLQSCEDLIDRAEAMMEIMMFAGNVKSDEEDVCIKVSDAVELLRELPPVTPTSSKMEQVEDAISKAEVIKLLDKHTNDDGTLDDDITCILEELPPIQPRAKVGKWIRWYEEITQKGNLGGVIVHIPHCKCSECNKEYDSYSSQFMNYCPNCGAKMESEDKQ